MKNCTSCSRLTRRDVLKQAAGWAAFSALARNGEAQTVSNQVNLRNTARACIFVYLNGAPSHIDTFDVKDGPWNPPGIDIQDHPGGIALSRTLFPTLSLLTGDMCILRSVRSWEAAHERGAFYMQTAHTPNPAFAAETPHVGAVVSLERQSSGPMPPFLSLNENVLPVQGSAFLGGRVAPAAFPVESKGLSTIEPDFFGSESQARFDQRYSLLEKLDSPFRDTMLDVSMLNHVEFYKAAKQMTFDASIETVFRFSSAEEARYGATDFGRAAIVARNAVRQNNGTVFVALNNGYWDLHQRMWDRTYLPHNMYQLSAELDTAIGALVNDLKSSGDFESTLIVMMGEFGRTPGRLNTQAGRDHHRDAMSVVLMGGGTRGGAVIGATDSTGDRIVDPGWSKQRSIVMEDIAATIYSALGIDWTKSIEHTPSGRKFEYVPGGQQGFYTSIEEAFA
jgi:hypothetical protein